MPLGSLHVIVSGPAASGKTSLGRELATALRMPFLSKDVIKAALRDVIAPGIVTPLALGHASVAALVEIAAHVAEGAVIDSVWRGDQAVALRRLPGRLVEVFCRCDLPTLRARYAARVRPPGYVPEHTNEADLWSPETMRPLGGWPLVEVDTSRVVDIPALARRLVTLFEEDRG